jgi:AAHS family 4-hydroxybenzoate transporter-like MFS transporter
VAGTISEIIDARPVGPYQWRVLLLCSLVILLDGYDLQAMALAVPALAGEWRLPPAAFGVALAAGLVGLGFGGAFVAPLGDRFGRRPVLIGCVLLVGVTSLVTTLATGTVGLAICRCLTGLALGACQGNATAMSAEFAPMRRRAFIITITGCNVALGSLLAGLTAPWVVAAFGWRGLFYVGGMLPVLLAGVLIAGLPESIGFLLARRPGDRRIAHTFGRMFPGVAVPPGRSAEQPKPSGAAFLDLLRPPLRTRTLVLWLIYSASTFLLYLVLSWLPTLLATAGWAGPDALRGIVSFQIGGIAGSILLALLVDRGRIVLALAGGFAVSAVAAMLFSVIAPSFWAWTILFGLVGAGISGAMFAIFALAAGFYPAELRATGYGWAAAVARLGAVLGPLVGAWGLAAGVAPRDIMALLAVPALFCALLVIPIARVVRTLR